MEYSRLTDRSEQVLTFAQKESENFKHGYIGTEHILLGILKEGGYASELLTTNGVTPDEVRKMVQRYIGYGDIKVEYISQTPRVKKIISESSIEADKLCHRYVSPEHILLSILKQKEGMAYTILMVLELDFKSVEQNLVIYLRNNYSDDNKSQISDNKKGTNKTPMLDKYSRDLTLLAKENSLDPVIGRDAENERILEILCRRIKNNPCLIGEPGVGKTAVVEGLAQRIVEGSVPQNLKGKKVLSLDLTSMIAGAKYRGEFEERLKKTMDEIRMNGNIIIFIDEIHTIIGAGGAEGAIDASNILKPSLARGEIQCIGATTIDEYRKYIEKDSALERRFQPIIVDEPTKEETFEILKGLKNKYEEHHKVTISDEAIKEAVNLADRYINDRFMPDKAIDLIDEACAKVRIQSMVEPDEVKHLESKLSDIENRKELAVNNQEFEEAASLRDEQEKIFEKLNQIKESWIKDNKSVKMEINKESIAAVVSLWTKIPVEKLTETESQRLLNLENILHQRVVGQDEAVKSISKAIRRARVGIKDPKKPIGSFIFLGPTGVGKTELCKSLAEAMFGDESNIVRIDMSEYMEKYSVSKLIGAPPGYVGYEEGGQLTEAVRRKPYSIVLLDEIEKAHTDVYNILLQIMDDGRLTDGKGKVVDFKNTIIIMTSNVGAHNIRKQKSIGFNSASECDTEYEKMKENILEELKEKFKPEFLNRLDDVIVFHKLTDEDMSSIVTLMLNNIKKRLEQKEIYLNFDNESKKYLLSKGIDLSYGARPLRRVLIKEIEDKLSEQILEGKIKLGDKLDVSEEDNTLVFNKIN